MSFAEDDLDGLEGRLRRQGPGLFHEAARAIEYLRGQVFVLTAMKDGLIEDKLAGGRLIRVDPRPTP